MAGIMQEVNATPAAIDRAERAGFSLDDLRGELGMSLDDQLAEHHADIAIGSLTGNGQGITSRATMRTAGYASEPDWDRINIAARLERLTTASGIEIPNRRAIVREDNNDVLNIVSDRYRLVQHRQPVEIMHEALKTVDIPIRGVKTTVGMQGGYLKVEWLTDHKIPVRPVVGDVCGVNIFVRSSYDGSATFSAGLSLLRLVCANGMSVPERLAGIRRRHIGTFSVSDAIARIQKELEALPDIQKMLVGMTQQTINRKKFERWLTKNPRISAGAGVEIMMRFDRDGSSTLWAAYNAVTWYSTHKLEERANTGRSVLRRDRIQNAANSLMAASLN